MKMKKIVIVEDDQKLRNELEIFLKNNGYMVESIQKFEDVANQVLNQKPNLILLDINLPGVDGEYILKEIRKTSNIPIIMITSRESQMDELLSINFGADDYVTKPFHTQILLARIASILKRTNLSQIESNKIDCVEFILNISKSMIETEEKEIELTKNELKILHFLAKRKGQIVSREELMEYLWDSESFIDDNTLTVNITRLRGKLEEVGLKENLETKRGQGYILK